MTMLRATALPPQPTTTPRAEVAALRDVPRLAIGHTAAITAQRPRRLRWLCWPAVLAAALQLIGQVGRGEVLTMGHGTSVVITPSARRPTPMRATITAALTYLLFVVLLPVGSAAIACSIGGPAGTLGITLVAGYLGAIIAAPLLAIDRRGRRGRRGRRDRSQAGEARLRASDSVRMHNLVRDPRDPAGTGVALLRETLQHPRYTAVTIVTTAASTRLATAYQAAGMVLLPDSITLHRLPQTSTRDTAA